MSDNDTSAYWITKEQVQVLLDYAHRYDSLGLMKVATEVLEAPMRAKHAAVSAVGEIDTPTAPGAIPGDAGNLRDMNNG